MTSKNLYFNLLKEDMKQRLWTVALAMLAFAVGLPIYAMLRLNRIKDSIEYGGIEAARNYYASIANTSGIGVLIVITIVGAIICGISGFAYLYSKRKVDLYHSIPVKREKLFMVTYINGVIIYVVPYLINLVIYIIIGAANGLLSGNAVSSAILTVGINLIGYLLVYSITIIAVMMTGNLIVGLLGTAVLMIYGPAVLTIKVSICELFFKTYYQYGDVPDQFAYVSPIFAYIKLAVSNNISSFVTCFVGTIVVTLLSIALGVVLYRIRPSEAAGKSMAFKNTQGIIKILIVLPTALVGGLLLMSMSETTSFAWMLFGIVFIGFLAHGIIEIIYNNDFKCMIANKIQLAVCIIVSLIIAGAAKTDLIQYDSYMPKESKVESMSVDFEDIEPNYEYFDLNNEYYDTNQFNPYNKVSSSKYRLDHINMTNFDSAYQLVKYAKDNNYYETDYLYENSTDRFTTFTVKYILNNKKEIYRVYTVKLTDIMKYVNNIYSDENYKEGTYQIIKMDRSLINLIKYYNVAEDMEVDLKLTEEQKQKLIDIYVADLKTLIGNELVDNIPITQLSFRVGGDDDNSLQSYYVYPQFTKTIEYMKSLGANLEITTVNSDNIDSITITDYSSNVIRANGDAVKVYTFTDMKQIDAIAKAIIPRELSRGIMIHSNIERNLDVSISYKYVGQYDESVSIIMDKLPADIRKEIGY
ncbi:MAG: DUF6449 domain-containing protein [Lachnotalea sp.]